MKKYLLIPLLFACSKQELQPVERSVTYINHYHNSKWELLYSDTSIHFCQVSGEELKRFESKLVKTEIICGTYNTIELVISKPCKRSVL